MPSPPLLPLSPPLPPVAAAISQAFTYQVFARSPRGAVAIECDAAMKVELVALMLCRKAGIDPSAHYIVHAGRRLEGGTIGDYGVSKGSTLVLAPRLRGGGGGGYSALMYSSMQGYTEIVQVLLCAGADKEMHSASGASAISLARDAQYEAVCNLLLR